MTLRETQIRQNSLEPYNKHSEKLCNAYKGYQGQEPSIAKYIFFSLDANFSSNIENIDIFFAEVLCYLQDGVKYWKKTGRHHPFLSPNYKKADGYKYHKVFSKMYLPIAYADKVSFVELLKFPTYGKINFRKFKNFLHESKDHILGLNTKIISGVNTKSIYIARGVYSKLFSIGRENKYFEWLPRPLEFKRNVLYQFRIDEKLKVYVITHFSDSISDSHLEDIKKTITNEN